MKHHFIAGSLGAIAFLAAIASSPWVAAHAVPFSPPVGNPSPSEATGGASRGSTFVPPRGNPAPRQSTGGASRGSVFAPPTDNSAPAQSTGGGSRGVFAPPTNNATPQQSTGGASRTNLHGEYMGAGQVASMIALTPRSFYGTTLSERPTFMAYVPASNAHEIMFSLKDANDDMYYQMRVPVSGKAGIVAIQLPVDAPALTVGKNYHWYLAVLIDNSMSPSTPFVDAWVQRVEATPQLQQALVQGNDLQDAEALATQGVWYDSVALLAQLRSSNPTSEAVANNWTELLNSVNLAEIAMAAMATQ
jgi:Domain of Unknown Function (DUF928)